MHRVHSDRGQSIVEFTLLLPFILLMIFAIAEFGFALYTQVIVRNAASEAARYAAVGSLPSQVPQTCEVGSIEERARSTSTALIACDEITITYHQPVSGQYARGSGVAVRLQHQYQTITPLPAIVSLISGGAFPTTWTLGACSDARLEVRPADQSRLTAGNDCS